LTADKQGDQKLARRASSRRPPVANKSAGEHEGLGFAEA
jgi:hypothetical protein